MNGRRGRPTNTYTPSWGGQPIAGLSRNNDGRWRIDSLNVRFTEPDERKAVTKARQLLGLSPATVEWFENGQVGAERIGKTPEGTNHYPSIHHAVLQRLEGGDPPPMIHLTDHEVILLDVPLRPEQWSWLAEQLASRPHWVADQVGYPELAEFKNLKLSRPLSINRLIDAYNAEAGAGEKAKQEATKPLERLAKHANATALSDLTTDKLIAWKRHIESTVPGPSTRRAYYSRIRTVVRFGKKVALDATQINTFLDRAAVLWTAEPLPPHKPTPISRAHFHSLLQAGGNRWRPWLLLGLNLCLHLEEVCALEWSHFDLSAGTYAAIRNKTKRDRIPRAAMLWPETIVELQKIKRTGNPFVLISSHGDRYNRNTRGNDFAELRNKAGVPAEITFDCIRDGAYTSACHAPGVDDKYARLLAGHKAPGLQDNYVLRRPEIVKPACDAVYATYGPFSDGEPGGGGGHSSPKVRPSTG